MKTLDRSGAELRQLLEALIRTHGNAWVRYVQRVLRNEADAEDAVQEAVRRVLARNRSFCSIDEVRMYLGRAISNTAIELYHERRRDRNRLVRVAESAVAGIDGTNPHSELEACEDAREHKRLLGIVTDGLARLPLKQYEALRITVMEPGDMSIRDAGMVNGIPYSTLRHRSLQGLRRLRRYARRMLRVGRRRPESKHQKRISEPRTPREGGLPPGMRRVS